MPTYLSVGEREDNMDKCYSFINSNGTAVGYISEDGYGNITMKMNDIFGDGLVFTNSHNILRDLVGSIDPNNLQPKSAIFKTEDGDYTVIFDNTHSNGCHIIVHHLLSNFELKYTFSSIDEVTGVVAI